MKKRRKGRSREVGKWRKKKQIDDKVKENKKNKKERKA